MEKRIVDFIKGQKVATVCCVDRENRPYSFSCYYAFDAHRKRLYFKSSSDSHHIHLLKEKPIVSGTILQDKLNPFALQGIQFAGLIIDRVDCSYARTFYHKRYPFGMAVPGEVYTLDLQWLKMTDNTLALGKKTIWRQEMELAANE